MANLLRETIEDMARHGKTSADIIFIGSADGEYYCSWDRFQEIADFEYHDGFGGTEIATDLVILFKDKTWMERGEYDGSEWWEFKQPPSGASEFAKEINNLGREEFCGTVKEMNTNRY